MKSAITDMAENSIPNARPDAPASLHPNQITVASGLGLDLTNLDSAAAVAGAIESKLGKKAVEERTRWFVISVLRHLCKAKWADPVDSGLDEARQSSLVKGCLAAEGFSTSLGTVTKDARSQFRFVGFASSKKIERGVLATGTKAYKIASCVILEAGLVDRPAEKVTKKPAIKKKAKPPQPNLKEVEKTVVGRRAKRRGYNEDEFTSLADTAAATSSNNQAVAMSEEEFANLNAALSKSDAEIIQQNWGDQQNEDRWSRILGVLAGVGFFAFVLLLFL